MCYARRTIVWQTAYHCCINNKYWFYSMYVILSVLLVETSGLVWVRSRRRSWLVTWFCYQLIAKPGDKTVAPLWPDRFIPLQWRHNGCNGVSNHHPDNCLFNCLFRRRSKKNSKLRVTGLCVWGIHRWPVNSPHKGPVARKMFPFDDVIMTSGNNYGTTFIEEHFLSIYSAFYFDIHFMPSDWGLSYLS